MIIIKAAFLYTGMFVTAGTAFAFLFGPISMLFQTMIVFACTDYIIGVAAAAYEGKLDSKVGYRGILNKVIVFVIIAVAHSLDQLTGTNYIQTATIFFYLSNELLSIIENAGRLHVPIPPFVQNAVKALRNKSDNK